MMNTKDASTHFLLLAIVLMLPAVLSCADQQMQSQQTNVPPSQVQPYQKQVDDGQAKKRAVEAEYKAMSVADLIKKLEADSMIGTEPFNSLGYREVVSRGAQVGPELAASIKGDRSSFITVLAVRKVSRDAYGTIDAGRKASIFVDALRNAKYFNAWGLPHLYWDDAGKAVIELGTPAAAPLRTLLQDNRDAPVWGSEEVSEYQKYKYRVKDYAWALLTQIGGSKPEIPVDPAARDRLIAGVHPEPK